MKTSCEVCNRSIEPHLLGVRKTLCFSCLTQELSDGGAIPTFNLKEKPIKAPCAVCERDSSGMELRPSPWGFICKKCCDVCQTQSGISWDVVALSAQKEWLIKGNGKIVGPYTASEVETLLRENRVVAHDEVMRPAGRWHLFRDEEHFRLVLNEVKNRQQNKRTNTNSATMTPRLEDITQDHLEVEPPLEAIQLEREAEIPSPEETRDLLKSYASRSDARVLKDLGKMRSQRLTLGLVVLTIAGLFAAFKFTQPGAGTFNSRDIYFQDLMEKGLREEKVGSYVKALSHYSEARTIKPDDPELLLHLAPLALLYDKQLLQAQRMFSQILDSVKETNYQKAANLGLGLVSLESHELDTAQNYFGRARNIDSEYLPAIADLGIAAFFKGDFKTAEDNLLRALEKGLPDGAAVMALADTYIAQAGATNGRGKLANAHTLLEQFFQLSRDYQQEILVQDARVLTLQGKISEAARRIETFLDIDPEQTDLHLHDWRVYRGRTSWGLLLDTLKKVSNDFSPTPRLTAAVGLAMYRGREKLEGAQAIEQALTQAPHDPLIMGLAGWVEMKLGRRETASVNIKQSALESETFKLPHILMARLCQEQRDFECSKKQWEMVLKLDGRSAEALHGLALASWAKKDRELTQGYLTQVYANDPSYIPYLQLVQEVRGGSSNGNTGSGKK